MNELSKPMKSGSVNASGGKRDAMPSDLFVLALDDGRPEHACQAGSPNKCRGPEASRERLLDEMHRL
jgi:hypothetical protein